jgi:hypothetical protein
LPTLIKSYSRTLLKAEANQATLDKEGKDRLSMLKSLYSGVMNQYRRAFLVSHNYQVVTEAVLMLQDG